MDIVTEKPMRRSSKSEALVGYGVDLDMFGTSDYASVVIGDREAARWNSLNDDKCVTLASGEAIDANCLEVSSHVGHGKKVSYRRTVGDPGWVPSLIALYPNFVGYYYNKIDNHVYLLFALLS